MRTSGECTGTIHATTINNHTASAVRSAERGVGDERVVRVRRVRTAIVRERFARMLAHLTRDFEFLVRHIFHTLRGAREILAAPIREERRPVDDGFESVRDQFYNEK